MKLPQVHGASRRQVCDLPSSSAPPLPTPLPTPPPKTAQHPPRGSLRSTKPSHLARLPAGSPRSWLAGLAGWLACLAWPAWPGLPGLPPPLASPPDATTGATGKLGIGSQTWPEEGAGNAPKGSAQSQQPAQSASYFRVCWLCRLWGEDQQPAQSPSHFRFCRLRRL